MRPQLFCRKNIARDVSASLVLSASHFFSQLARVPVTLPKSSSAAETSHLPPGVGAQQVQGSSPLCSTLSWTTAVYLPFFLRACTPASLCLPWLLELPFWCPFERRVLGTESYLEPWMMRLSPGWPGHRDQRDTLSSVPAA